MSPTVKGRGWITRALSVIPAELHLPGYNFCGPNTKLQKRLARGDKGINPLDDACLEHDKLYASTKDSQKIREADQQLAERAWQRVKSPTASTGEKVAAMIVTGAMKAKTKFGGKLRRANSTFDESVKEAKKAVKNSKSRDILAVSKTALSAAKKCIGNSKLKCRVKRILPIPKRGGILPFLVPLFAGLSAAGSIAGGAAAIAKAANDANQARKSLEEMKRHNKKIEAVAIRGNGFYLKPYKNGYGIFNPSKN